MMTNINSYLNALPLNDNDKLIVSKIRELRQLRSGLREFIENNKIVRIILLLKNKAAE